MSAASTCALFGGMVIALGSLGASCALLVNDYDTAGAIVLPVGSLFGLALAIVGCLYEENNHECFPLCSSC